MLDNSATNILHLAFILKNSHKFTQKVAKQADRECADVTTKFIW